MLPSLCQQHTDLLKVIDANPRSVLAPLTSCRPEAVAPALVPSISIRGVVDIPEVVPSIITLSTTSGSAESGEYPLYAGTWNSERDRNRGPGFR